VLIWRISDYADLAGTGGLLFSARWHHEGLPIVYAADHPASALCEMLVRTDYDDFPDSYQLLKIEVGASVNSETPKLPSNWQINLAATQQIGSNWLRSKTSALLEVPSVIVPECKNYLINPLHEDAVKINIQSKTRVPMDPRFRNLR
jgi:RES domain-containing protein